MNGRFLTPIKRRKIKREKFAVFDIEANDWTRFEMLGFYDGTEFIIFDDVVSFLNHCLTKKYRGWKIYAHNGGNYDFRFLLDVLLTKWGNEYEIKLLEGFGRIREIKIKDTSKHVWSFCDSFAILPESLRKLTIDFDVNHKKRDADYSNISKRSANDRIYLKHDCLGLFEVLQKFYSQPVFDGLKTRGTTASNAMLMFRTTLKDDLKGLNQSMENFIRETYFGGRVEIFKMKGERINHYDFNSLYPYVMQKYAMPVGFPVWVHQYYPDWPGFYFAEVSYPTDNYIPCLPIVFQGKLIFPVGKFFGFFTSIEIQEALKQGAKIRVRKGIIFKVTKKIFTDFITTFYKMKQVALKGSVQYLIAKLTLNSCYGKFGQKRERESIIKCSLDEATKRGLTEYMPEFGLYKEGSISRGAYILPHIASWITACARIELFQALQRDGSPYYCDTDSIFTQKKHEIGEELGALKHEGTYERAVFLRPKTYAMDGHTKAKGFSREMIRNLGYKDYEYSLLSGDYSPFNVTCEKFIGIKSSLKRFGKTAIRVVERKSIKSQYTKRRILHDLNTAPLELNEIN